ncbi:SDR family oxidoreductase [Cognataquiflexum rubidum]|uniref:SDR family oxidoreductase n=1 Tax=Cognataquiflexum rubidum TaxID=2922273 RepID=UPI001F132422|nr:SDR family oxidoreductase [Cognataquiflexum rubidum]MCH6233586.1 SDR family oxidoreductase [Cognataquiflexum rubidum]
MKNVLITGCSTGLGFETAAHLARNSYNVIATMRNPFRSPELGELAKKEGLPITILSMDVDQDESVRNAFQEALDRFGPIDVLVNNAGIASDFPLEETSLELFQQIFQTNVFGAVRCMKEVITPMRKRGEGLIINLSSIAGKTQSPSMAAYAATKSALNTVSMSLAGEVGRFGIRVAIVEPGFIDTPILKKYDTAFQSIYPNREQLTALGQASVSLTKAHPIVVAEKILDIITGKSSTFSNVVGPDAEPLLAFRFSMNDEQWIENGKMDTETFAEGMLQMGMDIRPYLSLVPKA